MASPHEVEGRALVELGCKSVPYKKGLYYWGATKPDVIEEKNAFVMEYCRAELQLPVWKGVPLKITSRGVVDVGYEQEGPRSEGKWLDCNGREWGGPRQPYLEVDFSQMATQLGSGWESLWPFVSTCVECRG